MGTPPIEAQWYLPTDVTVQFDGFWISGFEFCARNGTSIHVITAWNPGDERPSLEINEERNDKLRQDLLLREYEVFEALGSDPHSDHSEKSWAVVGMTDDEAVSFGATWGQVAVFRISEKKQSVLGCFSRWEVSRDV